MSIAPGTRLGPYQIEALVGAGGMGEVYRARDARLDRTVAVKILPAGRARDPEFLERFDREARAIAALNHPNICTIYDVGDADGIPFIAIELIDGETLDRRIARGRIPAPEATEIARQIVAGLEAAHAKGIVHRDVKPANVFLTATGQVKITDFGLATVGISRGVAESAAQTRLAAGAALTAPGMALGTAAYMSPEQARGEPIDARTDIFAVGAVLYEMLTGRPAFGGATLATVFDRLLHSTPEGPSAVAAGVPPELDRVVAKALQKDPGSRHQSASALAGELRALVLRDTNAAVASGTAPFQRAAAVRYAVVLAVLVVAVAGAAWMARRFSVFNGTRSSTAIRSIAVLPLSNLSAGSTSDYFTDGMTDELIGALGKIRGWRVISRTSVMQYKNARKPLSVIARELNVDAVVEGTVQQSDNRVRITARLVRATRDEENLWSNSYDREVRDVLDLEADVARAIADQIKVTVTPQERERLAARRPVDPRVLQLYLQGRASATQGTEDAIFKGIGYLEQAIGTDPMYAPAHAAIAQAYASLTPAYKAPKEVMPSARAHAVKAIEIDETLSEAHAALGTVMFFYDWDWSHADPEIQRAIELNPNSADAHELYGNYLVAVGKAKQGIAELTVAHELNPSALSTYASLLASLVTTREYDRAVAESRRAIDLHPEFAFAYAWLGMAYVMQGRVADAIPPLERARMLDENVTTTHFLAMAQAAAGNTSEAKRLVAGLEQAARSRYTCAYEVASVHYRLGDTQKAFEWLRRGLQEQCDCLVWLKSEPWIDGLRTDPRYADLVRRVGFPQD